jgi:hypothetical protein
LVKTVETGYLLFRWVDAYGRAPSIDEETRGALNVSLSEDDNLFAAEIQDAKYEKFRLTM